MTIDPTNADRAAWAKDALAVFTAATFSGDHPDRMHRGDLECAVADLVTDLLHYALHQHLDPGAILHTACGNFGTELFEEACQRETGMVSELVEALRYLLQQTLDRDLKYGITLSEGEADARAKALAAIAGTTRITSGRFSAAARNPKGTNQ